MPGRLALSALVTLLVAQAGCATRLDFDAVSAGWDTERDAGAAMDAASESASDAGARGQTDAEVAEAGRAPLDAGHTDKPLDAGAAALVDAAQADAGQAQADALTPTSDAAVDPALFSCAKLTPAPLLCDDFESLDDLQGAAFIVPEAAGSIGRDDHAARGGRGSLLAVVNPRVPTCSQCNLSVCVWKTFPELQGHQLLTIEFDLQVEQVDSIPGHRTALFRFSLGSAERGYSDHTLQLQSTGDGVEMAFIEFDTDAQVAGSTSPPVRNSPFNYGWQPGPPKHEWVHVKYELDAVDSNASGNSVRLEVGNVSLAKHLLHYTLRYWEPMFALGFPLVDQEEFADGETNEGWQARYDNVLVRIEPR